MSHALYLPTMLVLKIYASTAVCHLVNLPFTVILCVCSMDVMINIEATFSEFTVKLFAHLESICINLTERSLGNR